MTNQWEADTYYDTGVHQQRYRVSLDWIDSIHPGGEGLGNMLEVGGHGVWTRMFLDRFPKTTIHATSGDLRECSFGESGAFDLVCCMEVAEHIHDLNVNPPGFPDSWNESGIKHVVREMERVLKPGGHLFLTTPNACSCNVLWKAMNWSPPMMYRPHIREYSPLELRNLLNEGGKLKEARMETLEIWNQWGPPGQFQKIISMLQQMGCDTKERGEDIFILCRKIS